MADPEAVEDVGQEEVDAEEETLQGGRPHSIKDVQCSVNCTLHFTVQYSTIQYSTDAQIGRMSN